MSIISPLRRRPQGCGSLRARWQGAQGRTEDQIRSGQGRSWGDQVVLQSLPGLPAQGREGPRAQRRRRWASVRIRTALQGDARDRDHHQRRAVQEFGTARYLTYVNARFRFLGHAMSVGGKQPWQQTILLYARKGPSARATCWALNGSGCGISFRIGSNNGD